MLRYLVCPDDRQSPLDLTEIERGDVGAVEEVIEGILQCRSCNRWFPIENSIPRILPDELRNSIDIKFLKRNASKIPRPILNDIRSFDPLHKRRSDPSLIKLQEMKLRDEEALIYDSFCSPYTDRVELINMMNESKITSTESVLEVGAGTGRLTSQLLPISQEVVATDFSINSLEVLRQKVEQSQKLHLLQCDACFLPIKESSFDKVISAQMLEHIPTFEGRTTALKNMGRSLKQQGLFLMSVYNYGFEKRKAGHPKEGKHSSGIYFYNFSSQDIREHFYALNSELTITNIRGLINYWPKKHLMPEMLRLCFDNLISKTHFSHRLGSLLLVSAVKQSQL